MTQKTTVLDIYNTMYTNTENKTDELKNINSFITLLKAIKDCKEGI